MPKKEKQVAYLADYVRGTRGAYIYVQTYLESNLPPEDHPLIPKMMTCIFHIIGSMAHSTKLKSTDLRGVPIPRDVMRKCGGAEVWLKLVTCGVIAYIPHVYRGKGKDKCREYYLQNKFADDYFAHYLIHFDNLTIVNLMTGKPSIRRRKGTTMDGDRQQTPAAKAIEILHNTEKQINLKNIRAEYSCMLGETVASGHIKDILRLRQVQSNLSVIIMDILCAGGTIDADYATYKGAYRQGSMGRIYEVGGGFQTLPERMKRAAIGDKIKSGSVTNWDMQSAHPRMIRWYGTGANLHSAWHGQKPTAELGRSGMIDLRHLGDASMSQRLRQRVKSMNYNMSKIIFPIIPCNGEMRSYCLTPKGKDAVHKRLQDAGIDPDKCKTIVTAALYGLSDFGLDKMGLDAEEIGAVRREIPWVFNAARLTHLHLECLVKDCALNTPHGCEYAYLKPQIRHAYGMFSLKNVRNRGVFLTGKNGITIHVADCSGNLLCDKKGKIWDGARMLCHIVQGCESRIIRHVIESSVDNGYKVLFPEHDGATISGNIPNGVIIEGIRLAGLGDNAKVLATRKRKVGNDVCVMVAKPFARKIKSKPARRWVIGGLHHLRKETPPTRITHRRGLQPIPSLCKQHSPNLDIHPTRI